MSQLTAKQIARHIEVLSPSDSVGRAAELLRASGCPSVPVGEDGHLHGIVSEADLVQALMRQPAYPGNGSESSSERNGTVVRDIMSNLMIPVRADMPVSDLVQVFTHYPVAAVPVVDEIGAYQGMVSRADLTSAVYRALRPPTIGGMATPLGVFLTTGNVTAGAGHFALVLTGVMMALMSASTYASLFALTFCIDHFLGTRWSDVLLSPVNPELRGHAVVVLSYVLPVAEIFGFFVFFRLLPLTRYHAAEHQTVHAIERGLPLELSVVRTMPRPHPRCGTNIAAFVFLLLTLIQFHVDVLVALVVTFFTWKFVGMRLQYYFTTKPATDKHLLNGIAVGKELLEKYQEHVGETVPIWKKIWNMGLLQVIVGGALTYELGQLALRVWEWSLKTG